jgi:cold-inducible RNA-binding protein
MKNLYVGNLSFKTTQDELRSLFARYGEVESVNLITDRMTGQSKGFGFVVMDPQGAQEAIDKLNQTEVAGRSIIVNEARPREENRPSSPRRGGGFGGGGDRGFGGGRRGY